MVISSFPSLCHLRKTVALSTVVYPGRSHRVFAMHVFSLLCEDIDQIIHPGTMIRQHLYRSEEIVVRSVATDLFGETSST